MAKLMGMKGVNANSYCRFCKIQGTWSTLRRHVYCPLKTPTKDRELSQEDPTRATPDPDNQEHPIDDIMPRTSTPLHENVYDPRDLPMRHDMEHRVHAAEVCATNNADLGKVYGINYMPALAELPSIYFPRSFPVDVMHLIFQGLSPLMLGHWMGDFFKDEDYVLSKKEWEEIGHDLAKSKATFPSAFGRAPRDIFKFRKSYKASEHMNWVTIFSPIMLKDRLPDLHYKEWFSMTEAVTLIRRWDLSTDDIDTIENKIIQFVEYYESQIYRYQEDRVHVCRATIHYLLHISQCIRDCGPSGNYWQFPCERMCGFLTQKVKSRSSANRNLSLGLLYTTQLQLVCVLYPKIIYTQSIYDSNDETDMALEAVPPNPQYSIGLSGDLILEIDYGSSNSIITERVRNQGRYISTPRHLPLNIALYHFVRQPPHAEALTPNERCRLKAFLLEAYDVSHHDAIEDFTKTVNIRRYSNCQLGFQKLGSNIGVARLNSRDHHIVMYKRMDELRRRTAPHVNVSSATAQANMLFGSVLHYTDVTYQDNHHIVALVRRHRFARYLGEKVMFKENQEGATEYIRVEDIFTLMGLVLSHNREYYTFHDSSIISSNYPPPIPPHVSVTWACTAPSING